MNIKDIAKAADCTIDGMGYGEGNLEHFAKLIVVACIAEIERCEEWNKNHELQLHTANCVLHELGFGHLIPKAQS